MSDLRLGSRIRSFTQPRTAQPAPTTGGGLTFEPQLSGNIAVGGDAQTALEAAGATSVFTDPTDVISNFLDPQLSSEQQQALDAFRRTAIGRGLSGAGLESQVRDVETRLLAGNRLRSIRNIIGEIRGRAGLFSEQVSPFLAPRNTPGLSDEAQRGLFGGLTSLGFGDVVQGELFRREAGEQGRVQGLGGGSEEFSRALQQLFRPSLTPEQINLIPVGVSLAERQNLARGARLGTLSAEERRRAAFIRAGVTGEDLAAINRSKASAKLQTEFRNQIQQITQGLSEIGAFGLGGTLASPESILSANLDPFSQLLSTTGLLPR